MGHDLLPGCTTPWRHDCPGRLPASDHNPMSGVVCHCPCHALTHQLERSAKTGPVYRSVVKARLEKTRKFWTARDGSGVATGALASEILTLLAEHGIDVRDDGWQG